jgi:hypothetical protein
MATLYPPTGSSGDYSKAYIPDLADSANILTAFKNFYYGTTNGNSDLTKGIYGALETLYYGNPVLAGTLTVDGNLVINGTTTTVNSNEISIIDKSIELGKVEEQTEITGTVSNITGTGPWTATVTTTEDVQVIPGQDLTQVAAGTGTLYGGSPTSVRVATVTSQNVFTYTVTGGTTPTVGIVTSFTIGGATDWTANGAGIVVPTGASTSVDFKYYNATGSPSITSWLTSQGIHSSSQITSGSLKTSAAPSALFIGTGSSATYVQSAMLNTNANGSADFAAYASNGTESTGGWVDIGVTGPTFSDAAYTITGKNDGYLFAQSVSGAGLTGNLVLATGSQGTSNAIIFGTGGFLAANERLRIDSTGKVTTASSSTGNTKDINIGTGATSGSAKSGDLFITTGEIYSMGGTGVGSIFISTPEPATSSTAAGGSISIISGSGGSSSTGGSVNIATGPSMFYSQGSVNINNIDGTSTTNIAPAALLSGASKKVNIGTGVSTAGTTSVNIANNAGAGSTVNIGIGSSLGNSTTTINGALVLEDDLPIVYGGTGASTAPEASANLFGFTTTATSGTTVVLTNTSSVYQRFTGSTAQTITLPVVSTLKTGWTFHIANNNTSGNLTVNSSGNNLVVTIVPGTSAMITCVGTTLTTAASWEWGITDFETYTGTGSVVMGTSPTIASPTITGGMTVSSDSPILKTASFTVGAGESNFNVTGTATVVVTLPTPTAGRRINIVNKAAFAINSASSNVFPRTTNTLGTAICAATAGSWATLVANGTNWYIMAGG